MASEDIINHSLHPIFTKDTIKQDQLIEEFIDLVETIKNIRDKKIKDFVNVYTTAVDHTYKIDDPILVRHFLFTTIEEINSHLIKNNKPYRLNLGDEMYNHFVDQNEAYLKKKKFYNDDGPLNENKLFKRLGYLNKVVRSFTVGNKLFLMLKAIETDLYELLL